VGVHKRFNIYRSRFLWQEEQGVRKYHLVDWETVCTPKDLGGLGILNLDMMNIGLLCKWLWKLENESGMWQDILKKKYLQKETMSQIEEKPGVSQFWSGLVKVKEIFISFVRELWCLVIKLDSGKMYGMVGNLYLRFFLVCLIFP
jgi:hypothetical protein